jgi:ABC-type molybdate transport system permease subunit
MIDDFTLRAGAVVAAALVVAGPWLVAYVKKAYSALRKDVPEAQEPVTRDDAHTVVEIARRLSKAGNAQGMELCKKLLDVMLTSEAKK